MTRTFVAALAAIGLLAGVSTGAYAQSSTSSQTPGAKMQETGSARGTTGASGYAPGHEMQENGSVKGTTGASGYAPGHSTNGTSNDATTGTKSGGGTSPGSSR